MDAKEARRLSEEFKKQVPTEERQKQIMHRIKRAIDNGDVNVDIATINIIDKNWLKSLGYTVIDGINYNGCTIYWYENQEDFPQ